MSRAPAGLEWLRRSRSLFGADAVAWRRSATPADAVHLLALRFATTLHPSPGTTTNLLQRLAALEITGGAVYDAMVTLAAVDSSVPLATRDGRAKATYERVGAYLIIVA